MADGIEGMGELIARLQALEGRLQIDGSSTDGIRQRLLRSALVVLKAADQRIDAGGPGWAPNKTHTPLLHRTGRLLASLTANDSGNVLSVQAGTVEVGTNVDYARYLQDGTRFMPARRFLYIDEQVASTIRDVFAEGLLGA